MTPTHLRAIPLFAALTSRDLEDVAAVGSVRQGAPGEEVIREHDEADGLFVTLEGRVRVSKRGSTGPTVLAELGPGSCFGEVALMDGGKRSASVTCLEPCRFFFLGRPTFFALMGRSPALSARLFAALGTRLRDANNAFRDAHDREAALEEENRRMGAELDVARRLQLMVLPGPEELAAVADLDIDGVMEPATEVGGDYYDVLQEHGRVVLGMGDVSGHGLQAGVVMLMVQTAVRSLLSTGETDPRRILDAVNQVIFKNARRIGSQCLVTLCLAHYRDGVLHLSGQHEQVLVRRRDGRVERLDTEPLGMWVGVEGTIAKFIDEHAVTLAPGDMVLLHSDGVTEAEDKAREFYGLDRLEHALRRAPGTSARAVRDAVLADLRKFVGNRPFLDDVTLVVLRRP